MIRVTRTRVIINLLLVCVYLLLVDYFYDVRLLVKEFMLLPLDVLSVAVAGMLTSYLLRGIRTNYFFSLSALPAALGVTLIHNSWNIWLPGRTGEISFPILMKHYFSGRVSVSVYGLIWLRIMDLHSLLGMGLIVFLPFINAYVMAMASIFWVLMIPSIYLLLHLVTRKKGGGIPSVKLGKIIPFALDGITVSPSRLFIVWLLTLANWVAKICVLALLLVTLTPVKYLAAILAMITGEMTSILPLHAPGGIGTYEAGMAFGLGLFDVQLREGFGVAIQAHVFLLVMGLLSGLIAYLSMKRISL